MTDHDPMEAIEYELQEGRAFALGQAGRRLEAALTAFEAERRQDLLEDAADAAWCYMIVRETAGFYDHEAAFAIYRVPPVVRARIGVMKRT